MDLNETDRENIKPEFLDNAEIFREAVNISSKFANNESLSFILRGLFASTAYVKHTSYLYRLGMSLSSIGLERGINVTDMQPIPQSTTPSRLGAKEAILITQGLQARGLTVGLLHGHFRMWTAAHLAAIAEASEKCDSLLIGIEHSDRTVLYKNEQILFSEEQRLDWIYSAGIKGHVFVINNDDYPYSDEGYETLLQNINPNFYFGPDTIQRNQRAEICGVNYIPLTVQNGYSTSDFFENIEIS